VTTFFENFFIRKSSPSADFEKYGFFQYKKKEFKLDIPVMKNVKKKNKYLKNILLKEDEVFKLINKLFTNELREFITLKTGFCFSIDFYIFYSRLPIDEKDLNVPTLKQWYSYKWHFDKPNSKNMLKIIFPINIESEQSALKIITKDKSRKQLKNNKSFIDFIGKSNVIWGFYPNVCYHKDGIPTSGEASQIMFQLNPNPKWVINKSIHNRSKLKLNQKLEIWTPEPKFPFFAYFNDKKIPM
tara:strand:- start:2968 stop:3693 length:726 start_codon:yes stop_codon:yes gene_type:complete